MHKRVVLVTGASKGIGRAVCELLSGQGHHVIGLARGKDGEFPGELISVDLSNRAETADALSAITARTEISGVVNNAGLVRPQAIGEVNLDDFDSVLDLNLRSAVQAVQSALPSMRAAQWGRIVNVASLVVLGAVNRTAYASAKAGLMSMTRGWALELGRYGITANAVSPGSTDTDSHVSGRRECQSDC